MSILLWMALIFPGFAAIRRFYPAQMDAGLMGIISISYLATFAILAPPLIVCYVLNVPLAIFSAIIVIVVLFSLVDLWRCGSFRFLGRLLLTAISVELAVVVLEMILSARIGAFLHGDAQVHLTRIRHLIDYGLNNYDPFVRPVHYWFPIYHTNILHAFYAAAAQLTAHSHISVWHESLPWAQLLVASASYYLAWTVFDHRGAAWLAAMVVIANRGPVNFVMYPNQLAPFWLLPLLLAFVMRAAIACFSTGVQHDRRHLLKLILPIAATSVIIGMTHSLYVLFACIVIIPAVLSMAIYSLLRRTAHARSAVLLLIAAATLAGTPFGIAAKLMTAPAEGNDTSVEALTIAQPSENHYLRIDGSGLLMRHPRSLMEMPGGSMGGSLAFAAGLICAWIGPRRWQAGLLVCFCVSALLALYVPYLCTPLLRILGEEWVLTRLEVVFGVVFIALVGPAAGLLILRPISGGWQESAIRAALSILALFGGYLQAAYASPWTWREMLDLAAKPHAVRRADLAALRELEVFARATIPPGKVVLTHPAAGIMLTAVHNVKIVASPSASNGVPDQTQRGRDLVTMLALQTPWPQRRKLLQRYEVEYFLPTQDTPADWADGHLLEVRQSDKFSLLRLAVGR